MIKVTFKEVGHGDAIILEWKNDEKQACYGIVDANLKHSGINPVLKDLQKKRPSYISFIILSHPHYDHYSGLMQILEYCEKNKVSIGCFLHTAHQVPNYLQSAVKTDLAKNELAKLFKP